VVERCANAGTHIPWSRCKTREKFARKRCRNDTAFPAKATNTDLHEGDSVIADAWRELEWTTGGGDGESRFPNPI
jgi:hypothetical protein